MITAGRNGLFLWRWERLASLKGVDHGIFTRAGGVSPRPFDSLNVSHGIGDDPARVERNRRIIADCLQARNLIFIHQQHGDRVIVVGRGRNNPNGCRQNRSGDALVTDVAGRYLAIQVADCQAVLMADPACRVVANVHVGWRGSIRNILAKTVDCMQRHFGCRPTDILAAIGPSLGPCCAEFVHYRREIPSIYWRYKDLRDHFDFWAISRDQLTAAGLQAENITCARLCTRCRTDLFFSYRAEKTTGRFAAVIGLRPPSR